VTVLLAGLLRSLHDLAPAGQPGGWILAVVLLGAVVGLIPAAGALLVALVRKGIGSRYGLGAGALLAGTGVVFAGLLPLLVFTTVGRIFADPARAGFSRAAVRELRADPTGGFLPVSGYLPTEGDFLGGGTTVGEAFTGSSAFWLGYALLLLAVVPVITTVFMMIQARLALRRGPRWPSKFFWLPTLALTVLTARTPAGSAGMLWLGSVLGALAGIVVVALAGPPPQGVVQRSLAGRDRPDRPDRADRPAPAARPLAADPGPLPGAPSRSDRAAARFAAREPHPPVVPVPRPAPPTPARGYRPTLVAPAPPASTPPASASPGVPRFRLIRRLGSGGFGRVWLAQDNRLGHTVALKAAHAPDAETEQRIRREYRALAAVTHPHSVRIFDLVPATSDTGLRELDGMVLVMEYVEGQSLGDLVRGRGLLDDVAAARVWINLAGALEAAHVRGVMHRDVKPANVVVDQAGQAHLIDFGIARASGDATMTQTGFVLGTPDFLAPEIACGQRATPSSDSWQLAATVSYALTGHPPRGEHENAVSGLRAAASGAALSHLPHRTAHLALLRAAMDNDPTRRPPLRDVQRALDDWLRRQGASAAGPVTAVARR
jgi:eukaryotic-like serine/threonine-protein kinase